MFNLNKYSLAVKHLQEAIPLVSDALKRTDYPERVKDIYEYIEFNEGGLALEILCENLYEFSCPVPRRAYELIEKAGTQMEMDKKHWEYLKPLVID
jgi:hypothetical protein